MDNHHQLTRSGSSLLFYDCVNLLAIFNFFVDPSHFTPSFKLFTRNLAIISSVMIKKALFCITRFFKVSDENS
jgi:hypothetical protein